MMRYEILKKRSAHGNKHSKQKQKKNKKTKKKSNKYIR